VKKGTTKIFNKKLLVKKPIYITLSNAYAHLADFAVDPPQTPEPPTQPITQPKILTSTQTIPSRFKRKAINRFLARQLKRANDAQDTADIDRYTTWAEDERTALAKQDITAPRFLAVERAHAGYPSPPLSLLQRSLNAGHNLRTNAKRAVQNIVRRRPHVHFASKVQICSYNTAHQAITVTYDSGADGHYISEADRAKAQLPILRRSTKRVGVANGDVCHGNKVTQLPIPQLSPAGTEADTFDDFPHSLMSVGRTSDAGTISIFTRDGVTVHKETDVLITCKGEPILIGARDANGRYRIPLVQRRGTWQPRAPSKQAKRVLRQANSVYDLPSTEQAIKWMHAVCGYPVKSTWLAAIDAGNFIGWPLLTVRNVKKYYPETTATPKGHMNQTRQNVRSTKAKRVPLEVCDTSTLKGKKERDIYTKIYDVRETIFSDQTGQFPKRSLSGNRYIMVMVDIDSSGILVEPMKSRKDAEMIRAYQSLVQRLQRANITPKKHVLDNEVSEAMKELIRSQYNMQLELVPPGCHRRNAAEVAIRNFKAHFLSILAGVADDFPMHLWDRLLPQAEITINLLRQSNATPTVSAYAHMCGPFDYNKMPLAPMGCNVQVHEKSDKRGTWAFHSVDGWYLATSPEHYRTHKCHIKDTRNDRYSDTVQFQHKNITNPSVTPHDKIMHAIADCAKAVKGIQHIDTAQDLRDLLRITPTTTADDTDDNNLTPSAVPRAQPAPRVDTNNMPPNMRITRSMGYDNLVVPKPLPRVEPAKPPRASTTTAQIPVATRLPIRRRRRTGSTPVVLPTAPSQNTRSKTKVAAQLAAPPASNTRSRHRKSMIPAPSAIPSPLMRHPDYKQEWSQSSANEF